MNNRKNVPGFMRLPTLVIPLAVWQQMMGFVRACPIEVNGFGYLDHMEERAELRVSEVFLLEQLATAGSVEVDPETLARHNYDMRQRGENPKRMKFQWHSHVNGEAFFSMTDTDNIDAYMAEWMVSLVANKRSEYSARLDIYRPFRIWTPIEVRIAVVNDAGVQAQCNQEIRTKVREPKWYGGTRGSKLSQDWDSELLVPASAAVVEEA